MKSYNKLVEDCLKSIDEIFPWDLEEALSSDNKPILLDIREPYEFITMRILDSINIPRGILESACEYSYEETVPEIVAARDKDIVVICRSGIRSALATYTMQIMGYNKVKSLKTGLRGWNDFERPLVDNTNKTVDIEIADQYFASKVKPEQLPPS